jgi:hypothetical protein
MLLSYIFSFNLVAKIIVPFPLIRIIDLFLKVIRKELISL